MKHLRDLWQDEMGFVLSAELVIIATVVVIGLIAGLQCVQTALVGELKDVAGAIGSLNQSYSYNGKHGCGSWGCCPPSFTSGSAYFDQQDAVPPVPCDFGLQTVPSPYVQEEPCPDCIPAQPSEAIDGGIIDKGVVEPADAVPEGSSGCDEALPAPGADPLPTPASSS